MAPALEDITLEVGPKELVMVIGPVGSGKSSLISAFMGSLSKVCAWAPSRRAGGAAPARRLSRRAMLAIGPEPLLDGNRCRRLRGVGHGRVHAAASMDHERHRPGGHRAPVAARGQRMGSVALLRND